MSHHEVLRNGDDDLWRYGVDNDHVLRPEGRAGARESHHHESHGQEHERSVIGIPIQRHLNDFASNTRKILQ